MIHARNGNAAQNLLRRNMKLSGHIYLVESTFIAQGGA
jgi:hypothetical protein